MGIPLFKMAAEAANGSFGIMSAEGKGTTVTAKFEIANIDRAPLRDLVSTITAQLSDSVDYIWTYRIDGREFVFDTREVKEQLEGVPIDSPEIIVFIQDLLTENIQTVNEGTIL